MEKGSRSNESPSRTIKAQEKDIYIYILHNFFKYIFAFISDITENRTNIFKFFKLKTKYWNIRRFMIDNGHCL